MKYAAEMITAKTTDGDDKADAKWAEGYTYFRCAAGLFDADFAKFVEEEYSPLKNSFPSGNEMYCKLAEKMHSTKDLGFGVSMMDLGLTEFEATQNYATDCDLDHSSHSHDSESASGDGSGDGSSDDSAGSLFGTSAASLVAGAAAAYMI